MKKFLIDNKYIFILECILLVFIIYFKVYSSGIYTADSGYQMALNDHSFKDIIYYCSVDYHVPLFAFLLKIFCFLPLKDIFCARILLLIIIFIHFFIAMFPMERLVGKKISRLYCIFFIMSPIVWYFIDEVRMYSLANLLFLCFVIYLLLYIRYNKRSDFIKLLFVCVIGSYTHLLLMFLSCFFLLFYSLFNLKRKNYKVFKSLLLCLLVNFILFLPWVPFFIKQLFNLTSGNYWTYVPNNLFGIMVIILYGFSMGGYISFGCTVVMLFLLIILYILSFKQRIKDYFVINFFIIFIISFLLIILYCLVNSTLAGRYFTIFYSVFLLFNIIYFYNNYIVYIKSFILTFVFSFFLISFFNLNYYDNKDITLDLKSDIEMNYNSSDIYVYHLKELSLQSMYSRLFYNYNNFIVKYNAYDNDYNVMNDYDVFGNNVVDLDNILDIGNYTNEFFMVVANKFDSKLIFNIFDENNYNYKLINTYHSNIDGNYELYKVIIN